MSFGNCCDRPALCPLGGYCRECLVGALIHFQERKHGCLKFAGVFSRHGMGRVAYDDALRVGQATRELVEDRAEVPKGWLAASRPIHFGKHEAAVSVSDGVPK